MRASRAAFGSAAFFAIAPGIVAGVVPWWLTGWRAGHTPAAWMPLGIAGALVVAAGVIVLASAFARFVVEGLGTPAPIAPTERLVVGGLYRYVRNPMYLAVIATIAGQALLFWQLSLLWYAAAVCLAMVAFVRWYEEPTLARQFGAPYESYRRSVPGWLPRIRPWSGALDDDARKP